LERAHKEHGKLPWAELFTSSIAAARKGFPVPPRLALSFARWPAASAMCAGAAGNWISNPALADTMQRIATEGARVLQEGSTAEEIVARVRGHVRPGTLA